MRQLALLLILVGFLAMAGCKNNEPDCTPQVSQERLDLIDDTQLTKDLGLVQQYLQTNNITNVQEKNNVSYRITQMGTGNVVSCLEKRVKVKYEGRLMKTGTIFDSNTAGVTFVLSNLILAWQVVLPELPAGTKLTLYIPSGFGYGISGGGGGSVPSNANLIFDIELLETF